MNSGKLTIDLVLNSKSYTSQIEKAEQELQEMIDDYNKLIEKQEQFEKEGNKFTVSKEVLANRRKEIEKTSNRIIQMRKAEEKAQGDSAKGWNISLKGIKRLALGIVGISSLYGMASKASSAYLSRDTELAQKMQNVWVALGSFLAPMLEKISELMLKAVGYINVFVKALTGTDYIARANAKALDKQAKAQAKLNKETQKYDFDVIRTQQDTSGGGIDTSSLINIPELDDRLVKKLQDLALWLKQNEDLVKAVGIALGITFGAIAVNKLLSGIGTIIGAKGVGTAVGTGLAGLAGLLLLVADVYVITLVAKGVQDTINQYKELMEVVKNNTTLINDNEKSASKLSDTYWKLQEEGKATAEQTEIYANYLKKSREDIVKQIEKLEGQKTVIGALTGKNKELTKQQELLGEQYRNATTDLNKLSERGLIANDSYESLESTLNRLTKQPYKIQVYIDEINTSSARSGLSASATGGRHFATGGIVTQPTRAIIGEAGYSEAVVPMHADYLSTLASEIARFSGNGNGQPINIYLDGKLIQRQVAKVEDKKKFATNG